MTLKVASSLHFEVEGCIILATQNVRDQMVPKEQWETRSSDKYKNINHLNIFNQTPMDEINTLEGASSFKLCDETASEESLTNHIELIKLSMVSTTHKKIIKNVTGYPTMF